MYYNECKHRINNSVKFFMSCMLALVCSSALAGSASDTDDLLKETVEARWSAYSKQSFGDVYDFQSPTYRSVFPKELFIQQFNVGTRWRLTKIESIKYDSTSEVATVTVVIETDSKVLEPSVEDENVAVSRYVEKWLLSDDRWWFITTG